jgi:hypothetical protein
MQNAECRRQNKEAEGKDGGEDRIFFPLAPGFAGVYPRRSVG